MADQLSLDTVIIVACVCGTVVLILAIILIVLCCRRHETKYFYEKAETSIGRPTAAAVIIGRPTAVNCSSSSSQLKPPTCDLVDNWCSSTRNELDDGTGNQLQRQQIGVYNCTTQSSTEVGFCCNSLPPNDSRTVHQHDASGSCSDVIGGTLTSESRRATKKVIYEVIV